MDTKQFDGQIEVYNGQVQASKAQAEEFVGRFVAAIVRAARDVTKQWMEGALRLEINAPAVLDLGEEGLASLKARIDASIADMEQRAKELLLDNDALWPHRDLNPDKLLEYTDHFGSNFDGLPVIGSAIRLLLGEPAKLLNSVHLRLPGKQDHRVVEEKAGGPSYTGPLNALHGLRDMLIGYCGQVSNLHGLVQQRESVESAKKVAMARDLVDRMAQKQS